MTANVLPCVGRAAPEFSGIQSICAFMMPLIAPCRSGEHQTWPSDHATSVRSSCTLTCVSGASSGSGKLLGSKTRASAPRNSSKRAASNVRKRLYERGRTEPYSKRMRGLFVERNTAPKACASGRCNALVVTFGRVGSSLDIAPLPAAAAHPEKMLQFCDSGVDLLRRNFRGCCVGSHNVLTVFDA